MVRVYKTGEKQEELPWLPKIPKLQRSHKTFLLFLMASIFFSFIPQYIIPDFGLTIGAIILVGGPVFSGFLAPAYLKLSFKASILLAFIVGLLILHPLVFVFLSGFGYLIGYGIAQMVKVIWRQGNRKQ